VVEFEIAYTHNGESTPYARAGGRLNQSVAVTRDAPVLTLTQETLDTRFIEPIRDLTATDAVLGWTTIVNGNDEVVFKARSTAGGEWQQVATLEVEGGFTAW